MSIAFQHSTSAPPPTKLFLLSVLTCPSLVRPKQYTYHLRKCGIKSSAKAEEKDAVVTALGKRMRSTISTDDVWMCDSTGNRYKDVDKTQLMRHVRKQMRTHEAAPLKPGVQVSPATYTQRANC